MEPRPVAPCPVALPAPMAVHPEAVEFVRFCRERRLVGWPELYDEMWAVATRGLFRGYGFDDLAERGIEFGLRSMPTLAALAQQVIAVEPAGPSRRPSSSVRRGIAVASAG